MKRKIVKVLTIALAIGSVLAGCGSSVEEQAANTENIKIEAQENVEAEKVESENVEPENVAVEAGENEDAENADVENADGKNSDEKEAITENSDASSEVTDVVAEEGEDIRLISTGLNLSLYAQSSVNVRKGPGIEYEKKGTLATNEKVVVTGETDNGWYQVTYKDETCYVSRKYLAETEVEVAPQGMADASGQQGASDTSPQQETTPEVPVATINYPAGNYSPGSEYGPKLSQQELNQVAEAVNGFLASYDIGSMDEFTKVLTAHDYLCNHVSYAASWAENRANSAWGALVYGEAQCSGYARAMKALCDAMGVGCYYVHADDYAINPSHQWNVVSVNGNWYIIDVQCNDSSGWYAVFLVSDDTYASLGLSWDRSSVPACPYDYGY